MSFTKQLDDKMEKESADQCDSQMPSRPMNEFLVTEKDAVKLETKYVNQVYEKIAEHFSETRHKPWPKVAAFLAKVPPGSFVLDVGCGNGKNTKLCSGSLEVGCDASSNLAKLCAQRNVQVVVADCLRLPFRDNCVDVVVCIAVIHHMSTKSRRTAAVREIIRVLCAGGQALLYVWAFEQESVEGPSNYLKSSKPDTPSPNISLGDGLPQLPLHRNRTRFENPDVLVPWKEKKGGEESAVHHRFYHVFVQGELEALVVDSGGSVLSSYYDKGNWCVVMQKEGGAR